MRSVADRLKPGGMLIVSAPNKLQFSEATVPVENEFHHAEPEYEELVDWLSQSFVIRSQFEQMMIDHLPYNFTTSFVQGRNAWTTKISLLFQKLLKPIFPDRLPVVKSGHFFRRTEIVPLLPYRRRTCNTFVFVCVKK